MKDAFLNGLAAGFEKLAAPEAEKDVFSKILAKTKSDDKKDEGKKAEDKDKSGDDVPGEAAPDTDDEKGKTSEASASDDFDRIISKLGLGLKGEEEAKTASAASDEEPVDDRPSWIRKVAAKMDEEEEDDKKEKKEEKKDDKEDDKEDKDDDKKEDGEEGGGKMKALFAKMKS